jgi:hypothetical protein
MGARLYFGWHPPFAGAGRVGCSLKDDSEPEVA